MLGTLRKRKPDLTERSRCDASLLDSLISQNALTYWGDSGTDLVLEGFLMDILWTLHSAQTSGHTPVVNLLGQETNFVNRPGTEVDRTQRDRPGSDPSREVEFTHTQDDDVKPGTKNWPPKPASISHGGFRRPKLFQRFKEHDRLRNRKYWTIIQGIFSTWTKH